ncbi:hypothetical protein ACH4F6_37585 [Streptomyces sp. NPDC017936]|uniref:hypothetical protein n=1 Tax=Streptomyces sp. NPDC017936 TaxID=3365016 RepID=UPI0037A6466F
MNRREARREANFRAGLILESVLAAGWSSDPDVVERYGQDVADVIAEEMESIAQSLRNRGGRE